MSGIPVGMYVLAPLPSSASSSGSGHHSGSGSGSGNHSGHLSDGLTPPPPSPAGGRAPVAPPAIPSTDLRPSLLSVGAKGPIKHGGRRGEARRQL